MDMTGAYARHIIRKLVIRFLWPFAILDREIGEPLKRAWAYVWLSSRISSPLDSSTWIWGVPEIRGTGRLYFGKSVVLGRHVYFETLEDGMIEIGDNVFLGTGVHLSSLTRIVVGADSLIGEYTSIRDASHHLEGEELIRSSGNDTAAITIGHNVWIGRGVTILPGVSLGDGVIVGANAVITHSFPPGVVVAGIPAKPLTRNTGQLMIRPRVGSKMKTYERSSATEYSTSPIVKR